MTHETSQQVQIGQIRKTSCAQTIAVLQAFAPFLFEVKRLAAEGQQSQSEHLMINLVNVFLDFSQSTAMSFLRTTSGGKTPTDEVGEEFFEACKRRFKEHARKLNAGEPTFLQEIETYSPQTGFTPFDFRDYMQKVEE